MHHEQDFELLYEAYCFDKDWRSYLNQKTVLVDLERRYNLETTKNFAQLATAYDRQHLTKRCLTYHSADKCMVYFAKQSNLEGFVSAVARGAKEWVSSIAEICKEKHYSFVHNFFALVPTCQREACIESATKACVTTNNEDLFRCLLQHQVIDLKLCFITACEFNQERLVMCCLGKTRTIYEAGFVKAIENGHTPLVQLLLSMGARVTRRVFAVACQVNNRKILTLLQHSTVK